MQVDVGLMRFRVWYVIFFSVRWLYFLTFKFSWSGGPLWVGSYFGLVIRVGVYQHAIMKSHRMHVIIRGVVLKGEFRFPFVRALFILSVDFA